MNIAVWNANGLMQRSMELQKFLHEFEIDVMLISETHFTNKNYLRMPNYTIHTSNHPDNKAHGGTAIIISNKINHHAIENISTEYLQATNIQIQSAIGLITFSAVYCPPRYSISKHVFTEFFNRLGKRFIAGGDYNAKHPWWGSRSNTPNPKGRQLYMAIQENKLATVSTGEPTYWPTDINKQPDLIDFAVTKGISELCLSARSCLELTSDHTPVLLSLNLPANENIYNITSARKTNWNKFKLTLEREVKCNIRLKSNKDVDEAVDYLSNLITSAAISATTLTTFSRSTYTCSKTIAEKIKEKRKLRKIWQTTRTKSAKLNLNRAIKDLKISLFNEKNEGIQNYLQNLSATEKTQYSLWKATKKIKQPTVYNSPIQNEKGDWARSDDEKALAFGNFLESVFTPASRKISQNEESEIFSTSANHNASHINITFKVKEVNTIIKELKNKKSPGHDKITVFMIKNLPNKVTRLLTIIFNAIARLNYFPTSWKNASIILIPKPGKPPELVSSYRPISLLPILSKICEKLVKKRLQEVITSKNILPSHQFGFREKHSTIEQVNRVTQKIFNSFEENSYCNTVFLDVAQAFDKVWHEGLLYKLREILPLNLHLLIKSYISNRTFQIKINNSLSQPFCINAGVPQGSVLGPTLYLLFTADFPVAPNILVSTFADDTALSTSHMNPVLASLNMQIYLVNVEKWLNTWRITVNESKSTQITFTKKKQTCPPVFLNNKPIPQSNCTKYLGIHLDRRLTWREHIWKKRLQMNLMFKKMYWLLGRKSQLNLHNKVLIYKCVIKPVWTYGLQLFGTASNSNIEILQRFQNKVLRNIVNAPWYVPNDVIHKDLQMNSINVEITATINAYRNRIANHPNMEASNLLVNERRTSRFKKFKYIT